MRFKKRLSSVKALRYENMSLNIKSNMLRLDLVVVRSMFGVVKIRLRMQAGL